MSSPLPQFSSRRRCGLLRLSRWLLLFLTISLSVLPSFAASDVLVRVSGTEISNSARVDYGTVNVGSSSFRSFTLANNGATLMTSIAFSMTGAGAADYTLDAPAATSLLPGATPLSFSVTFNPSKPLPTTAAIRIGSNDPDENPFMINLFGTGAAAEIEVTVGGAGMNDGTSTVNFGKVRTGLTGTRPVIIRNAGNLPLTNLSVFATGPGYGISPLQVTSLGAFTSTQVTLSFTPSGTSLSQGTLRIFSSDTDEGTFDIALTGSGVLPLLDVESPPGSLLFDSADNLVLTSPVGNSSQRQFVLRNVSNAPITGLDLTLDGEGAANFSVTPLTQTTLAPNATTAFTLTFTPTALVSVSAALRIALDQSPADPFDIFLTGTGVTLPDDGDEDGDGIINMLEAAMGTDPLAFTPVPSLVKNGASLEYTITRSVAAQASYVLSVEFSDDPAGTWTTVDTSQAFLDSDDGVIQVLRYVFPAGDAGHRYVRIRSTKI